MSQLDLTSCDKERIHLINSIQGHGAFVAVTPKELKIIHVSENLSNFFDVPEPSKMKVGEKLNTVLPHELYRIIQDKLKIQKTYPFFWSWQDLDVYIYQIEDDLIGIEFEKLSEGQDRDPLETLREFLGAMKEAKDVAELSLFACRSVRSLTGMNRVMMYRFFAPTMYGEVIAEDRTASSHSFAGHRFPATDIPKPARDLYLKNQVRLIYDSQEKTSAIFPGVSKRGELDLSNSRLRGVSPIHIEYLKNMGVRGSFSLAVKVDDKLWGLIACHHDGPTPITHRVRAYCEIVANCLALSAPLLEKNIEQNAEISFQDRINNFFVDLKDTVSPFTDLFKRGDVVNNIFRSEGFAVISQSKVTAFGLTPLSEDIMNLAQWTLETLDKTNKKIMVTDSLTSLDEQWYRLKDQASGMIAIRLNDYDDSLLMLFRPEILQTIQWGGDPRKNFEQRNYQGQINPRVSFETWSEIIKNTSTKWLAHEVEGAQVFKDLIFDSIIKKNDLILELGNKLQKK